MSHLLHVLLALVAGAALSYWRGPDIMWDLQNYHFYIPHALLEGTLWTDLFVAGLQSYINPLPDLPHYLLTKYSGLTAATLYQGLWFGALGYLCWRVNVFLAMQVTPQGFGARVLLPAAATALSLTGVASVAQIGMTSNEVQVAAFVIAGLLCALHAIESPRPYLWHLACGAAAGAATGLKFTAATYVVALFAATIASLGFRRAGPALLWILAGTAAGFLLTYGWWGWLLNQRFGSPLFPFYNGLFRSEWFELNNFKDPHWGAKNPADMILIPFSLATEAGYRVSEMLARDPRIILGLAGAVAAIAFGVVRKRLRPAFRLVLIFFLVGYFVWIVQFGIIRYAVPLEVGAAGSILTVLAIASGGHRTSWGWAAGACLVAVFCAVQAWTVYPDFGHLPRGTEQYVNARVAIPPNSLLLVNELPLGLFAAHVDTQGSVLAGLNYATISGSPRARAELDNLLLRYRGSTWVLSRPSTTTAAKYLTRLGLDLAEQDCKEMTGPGIYEPDPVSVCPVR